MRSHQLSPGRTFLLGLETGSDLYLLLSRFVEEQQIEAATISFLGAVRRASLRYYDQTAKEYRDFVIDRHLEVLSGTGNVSSKDGRPFVHVHAAFGDADGRAWGGHINEGTEVFALEVTVVELIGEVPMRLPDEDTGLQVWGGGG